MNKMLSPLVRFTVLFSIIIAIAAPVRAGDLAERVPADALVYVGWQGVDDAKGAYEKSRLKAILDNSTLPKLFSETIPELIASQAGPDAQPVFDALHVVWHHPTFVYIGKLDFPKDGPPKPHVALVCDAGKDAAALEVHIKQLLKQLPPPKIPVVVKRVEGAVMFLVGEFDDAAVNLLAGVKALGEQLPSLEGTDGYKIAIAQVQKNAMLTAYVNVPGMVALGNDIAAVMPGGNPAWPAGRDALNLAGIKSAVVTVGFDDRDWGIQAFLGTDGSKKGLLAFTDAPVIDDQQLKLIPKDATWFAAFHFDAAKVLAEVLNIADKMEPRARKDIERGIAEASTKIGIDIQKDLLATMGTEWVAYTAPSVGGSGLFGLTIVSAPRDAAKFAASVDAIEKFITKETAQRGDGPFGRREPAFVIRKDKIGGVDVHHVPVYMINPAWAVHEGKFYVSFFPNSISGAVDASKLKTSILDNEAYVAARKRLSVPSPTMLSFFDAPRCAPEGYALLQTIQTAAETFAGEKAPATLLPPLHKITPELSPSISATWIDAAGVHGRSVEAIPASLILGGMQGPALASPALIAAVMLPSLGRAREVSNRSYDMANASGIMKGANVWANDNQDKLPEHLAQLVAAGYISPKQLVRRDSGRQPFVLTPAQAAEASKDWHAIEKLVDDNCDWVYLGKGRGADVDATEIILFQKPTGHGGEGIIVGYSDAHTDFLRPHQYEMELKATNEKRARLKLPAINFDGMVESLPAKLPPEK